MAGTCVDRFGPESVLRSRLPDPVGVHAPPGPGCAPTDCVARRQPHRRDAVCAGRTSNRTIAATDRVVIRVLLRLRGRALPPADRARGGTRRSSGSSSRRTQPRLRRARVRTHPYRERTAPRDRSSPRARCSRPARSRAFVRQSGPTDHRSGCHGRPVPDSAPQYFSPQAASPHGGRHCEARTTHPPR